MGAFKLFTSFDYFELYYRGITFYLSYSSILRTTTRSEVIRSESSNTFKALI